MEAVTGTDGRELCCNGAPGPGAGLGAAPGEAGQGCRIHALGALALAGTRQASGSAQLPAQVTEGSVPVAETECSVH